MGAQQDALTRLLRDAGYLAASHALPRAPSLEHLGLSDAVDLVYRALGGRAAAPRLQPGAWDVACKDFVVELDEKRHFNRYRAVTLQAQTYDECRVLNVANYVEYCTSFEGDCLRSARHGGYWTNASAEREFGPSGPPGVLDGLGPARWRQRAFYDFVKDLYATATGLPLARVSVWERLTTGTSDLTLGKALKLLAQLCDDGLASRTLDHLVGRIEDARQGA